MVRTAAAVLIAALAAGCSASTSGGPGSSGPSGPSSASSDHPTGGPSTPSTSAVASSAPASGATAAGGAATVGGRILTQTIPGPTSHFRARPAEIWLPPILQRQPHLRLPVLELLHGTPGSPSEWAAMGAGVLNAFAAAHGGQAPIVVMPDINGSARADTECIRDSAGADVERYLTVDVTRWVDQHLPVRSGSRWGLAGISEGGTCALMLALRYPRQYGLFGDFSGLARPTTGDSDDPATTVRVLFSGSRSAYDQHDPLWLLGHHRYPTLVGWVEYGTADRAVRLASLRVVAEARAAGIPVHHVELAGGHQWAVWISTLRSMLPWAWRRLA